MATKYVYFFGNGDADGDESMRAELGGKGANLAQMAKAPLSLPVPPGFTITTDVCQEFYKLNRNYPEGLAEQVDEYLGKLEAAMGKKLGDENDPLLVSVRSGAAISMPGMMDTILNLGLNDKAVIGLANKTGNERFAWDAYRRFIQMYGDVAMGVDHDKFEAIIDEVKAIRGIKEDTELTTDELKKIVEKYKAMYKAEKGEDFPQDAKTQMWGAIGAVFGSWMNPRAIKYRKLNNIKEGALKGTAVSVMAMVFGNKGDTSGTGVCFSRDPSTGENVFMGEYLMNAQGEDVVAGIRTPQKLAQLEQTNKAIYDELCQIRDRLEKHYHDMQDMEFTVEEGKLFMLQCRNGKRTGAAAVKMAVDMVAEGLITKEQALLRVEPEQLNQLLLPQLDKDAVKKAVEIASGLNASPGAGCGQIVFTADEAEAWAKDGKKVLLVRKETSPDDIAGMAVAQGILTSTGGRTSHAAVVARGMGTPCVCGCADVKFKDANTIVVNGKSYKKGAFLTIDGATGKVYEGQVAVKPAAISGDLEKFLGWADEVRAASVRTTASGKTVKGFNVLANGDTPQNAKDAFRFDAMGIGLCRTEHMFFEGDRIKAMREMIIAKDEAGRRHALAKLLPMQRADFEGIFEAMDGFGVTIRLLDPPLHEFVPHQLATQKELAEEMGITVEEVKAVCDGLEEFNPMLGHRGCRLGNTYPEITEMQARAIIEAALNVKAKGIDVHPEIMVPLVGVLKELQLQADIINRTAQQVFAERGATVAYKIGTMIEVPRAALVADQIATVADFFSFGTNDLTQMTFGYSRDDAPKFLKTYKEIGIIKTDPFEVLDQEGVGQLVAMGTKKGRSTKPELKVGICGEHGGEPSSVKFCTKLGMNYVSCSPFRVPIARVAAAQGSIEG